VRDVAHQAAGLSVRRRQSNIQRRNERLGRLQPPANPARPKNSGIRTNLWTTRLLARHARQHGPAEGNPCLARLVQGTFYKILNKLGGFTIPLLSIAHEVIEWRHLLA